MEMGAEVEVEVKYMAENADKKKDGGLSNKKKLECRMKIADLKQICIRPDVVEVHSPFQSSDPTFSNFIFAHKDPLCIDHLSSSWRNINLHFPIS